MVTEAARTTVTDVPALIVGGSLVGLAASMFLGMYRVPCLSVEKYYGTAIQPRAGRLPTG